MRSLFLITLLLISACSVFAKEVKLKAPEVQFISKKPNQSLEHGSFEVVFYIKGVQEYALKNDLLWSMDGNEFRNKQNESRSVSKIAKAGKHAFSFYIAGDYEEIHSDQIDFEAGYTYIYHLNFNYAIHQIQCEKPVIYLYPESRTEVELDVKPKGQLFFTYPLKPENGWSFLAEPDGTLYFGQAPFRYLFWESTQRIPENQITYSALVEKKDVLDYLETNLSAFGLTSQEKADMITYWAPRMMQHDLCAVKFLINSECDRFAELEITPKPDNVNRLYLVFKRAYGTEEDIIYKDKMPHVFDRNGFDVFEWGGIEMIDIEN